MKKLFYNIVLMAGFSCVAPAKGSKINDFYEWFFCYPRFTVIWRKQAPSATQRNSTYTDSSSSRDAGSNGSTVWIPNTQNMWRIPSFRIKIPGTKIIIFGMSKGLRGNQVQGKPTYADYTITTSHFSRCAFAVGAATGLFTLWWKKYRS